MDYRALDFQTDLKQTTGSDDAWELLQKFVASLGFDYCHTWFGTSLDNVSFSTNCPDWWLSYYQEHEVDRCDAMAHHCVTSHGPIVCGVDRRGHAPNLPEPFQDVINFARDSYGLGAGVAFPIFQTPEERIGGVHLGVAGTLETLYGLPPQNVQAAIMAATAVHTRRHLLRHFGLRKIVLSPRERECLLWLCSGLRTKEIADKLCLSEVTVTFHINNAKAKLGADTREQAVARAVALGLITP